MFPTRRIPKSFQFSPSFRFKTVQNDNIFLLKQNNRNTQNNINSRSISHSNFCQTKLTKNNHCIENKPLSLKIKNKAAMKRSFHTTPIEQFAVQRLVSEEVFDEEDAATPYHSTEHRDSIFIDRKITHVQSGKGGDGHVSFLRLPFVPKGGPDGGDGGDGGSVWIEASDNLSGKDLRMIRPEIVAPDGEKGKKKQMGGKNGKDIVIQVPRGTVVRKYEIPNEWKESDIPISTKTLQEIKPTIFVADLHDDGQRVLLAQGGKGGYGNQHFATASDQAPMKAQKGTPGQSVWINIELKCIADIGLVGYPNAGKSTFLSKISLSKPAISTFPFTTLSPNLGVVSFDDDVAEEDRFTVADLPGLIEGAHVNIGLGHTFLRHIERTRMLVYVLDMGHYENIGLQKEHFLEEGIPQLEEATVHDDFLKGAIIPDQFDISSYLSSQSTREEIETIPENDECILDDYHIPHTKEDPILDPKRYQNQKRRNRMSHADRAEFDKQRREARKQKKYELKQAAMEKRMHMVSQRIQLPENVITTPSGEKYAWSDQEDIYTQDVRKRILKVKHQIYMYKPWEILLKLEEELNQYQPGLASRAKLIIANKMDVPGSDEHLAILRTKTNIPIVPISAKEGYNIEGVLSVIRNIFREQRKKANP